MRYLFIGEQPEEEASLGWFYNPIHDMESVWWLFAWSTLNRDIYFVRPVSDSAPNTDASSSIGVVTRSRQRKLRQQLVLPPGEEAIDADDDQIAPVGITQETRETRVQRIRRQHALALELFVSQGVDSLRVYILFATYTLRNELREQKPLHPAIRILGDHLCTSMGLLVNSYKTAEARLVQLPGKAKRVADKLHDQLKAIFDEANQYVGGLGVEVGVRKLSTEHKKILEAEKTAQERWRAAHAAELARLRAEGSYRLFVAGKNKLAGSSKDTPQPPSRRGKKSVGPSGERPRKHIHTLPSVPEGLEIGTGSESRPEPSTLSPLRTPRAVLPPVPEEGVTNGPPLAGPNGKRKQVDCDDAEVATAGPSRPTRASTRKKLEPIADPSTEPPQRKPSRRAPARVAKVALPPPPPKRKRATPAAPSLAPAMNRGRSSRVRVIENALATDTAHADEEPEEAPRPSKKRRVEAEAKPNPKPGGRVLRPRKR